MPDFSRLKPDDLEALKAEYDTDLKLIDSVHAGVTYTDLTAPAHYVILRKKIKDRIAAVEVQLAEVRATFGQTVDAPVAITA